jgi:hypothetical protein
LSYLDHNTLDVKIQDVYYLDIEIHGVEIHGVETCKGGRVMTSLWTDPRAVNMMIDARVEQLRGGRTRSVRGRLPRRN